MEVKIGEDAGATEESKYVPMGTFSILVAGGQKGYLKSTGFGTCIGVAMHNATQNAGVLAHFMSHQAIRASFERIAQELNALGISSKGRNWDVVIFAGGGAAKNASSSDAIGKLGLDFASKGSVATSSIGTRLKDLELDLASHAAKKVEVLKNGVESCSLDVVNGVLHLSNETFLMHKNSLAAISGKNTPLLYDTK